MIREHEELSEEYENLQKELDTLKSKLNHIDYFKWLEEELGHTLDKNQIISYANFALKNQKAWQKEHNSCANKYGNVIGFSLLAFVIIFELLWVALSGVTNACVLLGVGALVPSVVILSVFAVDSKRINKQQTLIQDKYDKQMEFYLNEHSISSKMKQLIDLGLSNTNAYYKNKFNNNDLFMNMYYILCNKEDYMNE